MCSLKYHYIQHIHRNFLLVFSTDANIQESNLFFWIHILYLMCVVKLFRTLKGRFKWLHWNILGNCPVYWFHSVYSMCGHNQPSHEHIWMKVWEKKSEFVSVFLKSNISLLFRWQLPSFVVEELSVLVFQKACKLLVMCNWSLFYDIYCTFT